MHEGNRDIFTGLTILVKYMRITRNKAWNFVLRYFVQLSIEGKISIKSILCWK